MAKHFTVLRVPEEVKDRIKFEAVKSRKTMTKYLEEQFPSLEDEFVTKKKGGRERNVFDIGF